MEFQSTYLYIKRHSVTEKLYFGKTTKKDPIKYLGSGTRWNNHIKKHGKEYVETLWYCLFTEKEELVKFALLVSEQQNITQSVYWLNLKPEDGLQGAVKGTKLSIKTKEKIALSRVGFKLSQKTKDKISVSKRGTKSNLGNKHSEITKQKMSTTRMGNKYAIGNKFKQPLIICPHCGKEGGSNVMPKWHLDKCKYKQNVL